MPTAAVSSKMSAAVTREVIPFIDLSEILNETVDRSDWQRLSEASLLRLWDNEQDAVYDVWRELY